jgi:iron complex outermembrane receptor protein
MNCGSDVTLRSIACALERFYWRSRDPASNPPHHMRRSRHRVERGGLDLGTILNNIHLLRLALMSTVCAFGMTTLNSALAQSSTATPSGASALPPVVVTQPAPARRRASAAPARAPRAARTAAAPRAVAPRQTNVFVESPRGPIQGYVANRSMAGTKTNTPINETPQSISVIGAEQIRDQAPRSLDQILGYAPGVVGGTFGNDVRNDWFLIRGFKSDDNSLFLDGMQLFNTGYATWKLQPFNLERVEVLRGPSAILYGGSSPSGLVNAVSKLPPSEPIRYIEGGVDNYGNRYVGFDIGGPVAMSALNGTLSTRLVGRFQGGDTQTDYTQDNNFFLAPSLTWRPDADTSFTLLASASHNNTRGQNFLPYVGSVVNAPFGRIGTNVFTSEPNMDTFDRTQEMIGYQFEKNLSDSVTFRQNARFAHVDVKFATVYGNGYATTPAAADLARFNFLATDRADQATMDNQLEYRFSTGILSHTTLFGLDLKYYSIDDQQKFNGGSPINLINPVYTATAQATGPFKDQTITQKQVGVYLQDQIKLDRFTLVLSGRNDFVDIDNNNRIGTSLSRDDSKFSGRAGLIYNFDSGVAPYVSYATSYNPIIGVNGAGATSTLQLPETGQQAEIGVKYQPAGFNGHFGLAYFDLKRQNVITTDPTNALLQVQNGEQTSRGLELEAVANLAPGFKVTASFTTYNIFVSKDGDQTLIGKVPVATPSQLASGWADYTFQDGWLRGFGFGAGVRYVGGSYADAANTLPVQSRALGDLAVHYDWQNWRFAINANNVTDEIYVANCSTVNACFYGDRRRVTGSIGYKW